MKTTILLISILAVSVCVNATTFTVSVVNFAFNPSTINATCGDTVKWIWVSGTHTTSSTGVPAGATTWNANITSSAQTFSYKLTIGGTYTFQCNLHPAQMQGTINVTCPAVLSLTAFFQGYYSGNRTMQRALFNSGIESNPNSTNVDTVTVSLINPSNGSLVQKNKGLIQTNGTLSITFPATVIGGSFYIKVNHRNAVETWSAHPQLMSSTTSFNFSVSADSAFGRNMVVVDNIAGKNVYAFWSGDVYDATHGIPYVQDGVVESGDYGKIESDYQAFLFGYFVTDVTGDGVVESADYGLIETNYQRFIFKSAPF